MVAAVPLHSEGLARRTHIAALHGPVARCSCLERPVPLEPPGSGGKLRHVGVSVVCMDWLRCAGDA